MSKKKENSDIIMFDVVDVKNSNAEIFMKYYIDDIITISNSITKIFFEFESFLKKESAAQMQKKKQKKKLTKNKNESFEKTKEKKTNE